ncbi:MAG TPA: acetylglutamate kinase [Longimicrobiaceae bacterium]
MRSDIVVVKVGGNEIDDARWLERLAGAVAARTAPLVLVHGGGREVTELQRTLGAEPEWRDGLRVTTPEALRAVSMVLSGLVNKRLAALLLGAGVEAVGISGEDGGLLRAEPARGGQLGLTGEIRQVKPQLLLSLLESGYVPVVSPVSRGPNGGALNVNADDAAAAVAAGVAASRFLMVSNIPGVLDGEAVIPEIDAAAVEELIASGVASGGMAPKLRAAARAAAAGVGEVRIGGLELLIGNGAGTRVVA